jgi:hypothetical protein
LKAKRIAIFARLCRTEAQSTINQLEVENPVRSTSSPEDNPAGVITALPKADRLLVPKFLEVVILDFLGNWEGVESLLTLVLALCIGNVKRKVLPLHVVLKTVI